MIIHAEGPIKRPCDGCEGGCEREDHPLQLIHFAMPPPPLTLSSIQVFYLVVFLGVVVVVVTGIGDAE